MAYLVLARKYRPEHFADMVGQEHIARVLTQAIEQSRTHHAYLFCGVRGLGKTSAARILARAIVCEHGPTPTPCNRCEQCLGVTHSRSVDVREIDGASHNSVDDIRALREQVHYLPQSARKKIYIIDEVHMLTTSAFNALLKTLEEPPPHVLFIFATTDPHKVLPTILSRVSRLDFRRVGTPALADHLAKILEKEGAKAEAAALRVVAQAGEGSVRDALTQMEKVLAFCEDRSSITAAEVRAILGRADPNALSDIVQAVLARDVQAILEKLDDTIVQGGDARNICLGLLREFRNLTVLRLTPSADALVDENPSRLAALRERAQQCDPQHLSQLFDRLMRSAEKLERAPSPRLALEMALIELAIAPPLCDISKAIGMLSGGSGPTSPRGTSTGPSSAKGQPKPSSQSSTPGTQARAATPKPTRPLNTSAPKTETPPAPAPQEEPRFTAPANTPIPEASRPASSPEPQTPAPRSALAKELWKMVQSSQPDAPKPQAPAASASPEAKVASVEQGQSAQALELPPSPTFERWMGMLDHLRASNESMMLAMLSDIGVQELSEQAIVLRATPGNFSRQKLQAKGETRERFLAWLQTGGLDPATLRWEDGAPSLPEAPSWSLFHANARKLHRKRVSTQARENPGIGHLVDALDAEIVSVRVLRDHTGQAMDTPFE